ncbi:MAG: class I SAM-dependent methyltransferase [Chloroflexaceae bacterium]|nr:class I SAM-dependent methyltransferase [Chloroflexaceae bacterium]
MSTSPIDFVAAWAAAMRRRPSKRLDPAEDRAFWQQYAAEYDVRAGSAGAVPRCLALVAGLLGPDDTLLDVGAGTGRFTLPLARHVRSVTALDQSAAMLDMLERKASLHGITNIRRVEADWPNASVEPHDVVLAAWSLYRQLDIGAALARLVAVTRRTLVVLDGVGNDPPHRPLFERYFGAWSESELPNHLYLAGALWQQGLLAEVRIVTETRIIAGETAHAIAGQLAPLNTPPEVVTALAYDLAPLLAPHEDGYRYVYQQAAGAVIWHADCETQRR